MLHIPELILILHLTGRALVLQVAVVFNMTNNLIYR